MADIPLSFANSKAEYLLFLAQRTGLERDGVSVGVAAYVAGNPFKSVLGPVDGDIAIRINYELSPDSSVIRRYRRLSKTVSNLSRLYRFEDTPWGRVRVLKNHGRLTPCVVEIVTKAGLVLRLDTELTQAELNAQLHDPHVLWAVVFAEFPEVFEFVIFVAPPRENGKQLVNELAGVWGLGPLWEGVWANE